MCSCSLIVDKKRDKENDGSRSFRAESLVSYTDPQDEAITRTRNVEVIVIDSARAACLSQSSNKKEPGCDWIPGEEIQDAFEYLSDSQVESARARGIDIIAIFATPVHKRGHMHAVSVRWLVKPMPVMADCDSEEVYHFFSGLLSKEKGKMEIGRMGGSNGIAHVSKEFLKMLHLPGITPRKSHGVLWFPLKTKWIYLYISPYHKYRKLCCRSYCQPLPGGQVHISKDCLLSPSCPKFFKSIVNDFLMAKAESAPLVDSLNSLCLYKKFGFIACRDANVVQNATNCIARLCAKRKNDPKEFVHHLLTSCSITVISYATRLHVDTPKVHRLFKAKSFWENKLLVEVPSQGTHDLRGLALGRGGAGRGKFVMAILDHSYDPTKAYGWGDPNEQGNGELFRELIQAARMYGLDGPDALASRALMPHLMEAAIDNDFDHHLLAPE
jgi:hypothetical protein